ncbi:unnamed protein product, partial [Tetraodon nigroviridis]
VASAVCGAEANATSDSGHGAPSKDPRQLNTFFGVMVPTILSMFSIILFLRTGFVVGHAGLLQGLLMLAVAYTIISLTILSICAISTNGAIQGGGAYCILTHVVYRPKFPLRFTSKVKNLNVCGYSCTWGSSFLLF